MVNPVQPASQQQPDPQPLKVEMVLPQLYVGGMEIMVAHLMRELRQRGHAVGATCVTTEGPLFGRLRDEGFRMRLVPTPGWRNLISPSPLIEWFRAEAPDIVHIHSGVWPKAAIAAKRAGGCRVIFTHHGLESREGLFDRLLNWYAARHTDHIVAVSDDLRRKMRSEGGVPRRDIDILPNGVPTDVFSPEHSAADIRTRFAIPADGFIVGNVARMWPVKNHLGLLDAFAHLRARRDDVYLVLVGDGPLRPEVEERMARNDLAGRVFLTGEERDLAGLYRAFDVFALASLSEGTSISILEAMASGTRVVATAVGGNPSLLGEGAFGTLVTPNDPRAFADALDETLRDGNVHNQTVTAARDRVTQQFSVRSMCDAYEALYYDRKPDTPALVTPVGSPSECVG